LVRATSLQVAAMPKFPELEGWPEPHWPAWALAILAGCVVASAVCFVLFLAAVACG
jgi:hypothetical protein